MGAHGSFATAKCTSCQAEYSQEYFRDRVINMSDGYKNAKGEIIPWCKCTGEVEDSDTGDNKVCDGNVKPDIVFFGEDLPRRYFDCREQDLLECDLLIIAGTSLKVTPFAHTVNFCNPKAPRVLINNEVVGISDDPNDFGLELNMPRNYRDVGFIGSCDEGILLLADLVGWRDELMSLILSDQPEWSCPNYSLQDEVLDKNFRTLIDKNERKEGTGQNRGLQLGKILDDKLNNLKQIQDELKEAQSMIDAVHIDIYKER